MKKAFEYEVYVSKQAVWKSLIGIRKFRAGKNKSQTFVAYIFKYCNNIKKVIQVWIDKNMLNQLILLNLQNVSAKIKFYIGKLLW